MFILAKIKQIILLLGDLALLFFSLYLTLIIRYSQTFAGENWHTHIYPFAIIYFTWVLVFYSQNLYNLNFTKNNLGFFKTFFESFAINILMAVFFFYFTPFFGIAPKTNLFLNAIIAVALLTAWRAGFNIVAAKYVFKNKIAFFGYSKAVQELLRAFRNEPQLGYEYAAIVAAEGPVNEPGIRQFSVGEFFDNIKNLGINTIAIGHEKPFDEETNKKLYNLIFSNITFVNSLNLYEQITAKLPLETLSQGWFLENLQESEKKVYDRVKIIIDYALGLFAGTLLLALYIPVAAIILITSGRPVFYSQIRVGKNGKEFKIHKFRTMVRDAEAGAPQRAVKNDNRVTKFGRFLRRTRIDELPQVMNVLRGDMSFIGPRPERPEFVRELSMVAPFYPLRHLAKPGLTGWAQINYNYASTTGENLKKLQYDIFYIKNRSFLLDMTIILKTFNTILRFRGM